MLDPALAVFSALSYEFRLEPPHIMIINVAGKGRPVLLSTFILYFFIWSSIGQLELLHVMAEVWRSPPTGFATITHYTLPLDYITSKNTYIFNRRSEH
jgi:hypothetical protein